MKATLSSRSVWTRTTALRLALALGTLASFLLSSGAAGKWF